MLHVLVGSESASLGVMELFIPQEVTLCVCVGISEGILVINTGERYLTVFY